MNSRAIYNNLLLYLDSLFDFLPQRNIRSWKVGLFLAVCLYLATARALVLHSEESRVNMSLDTLSAVGVPASVHHMRSLVLQIVLLQAQYTLQMIIQILDFEDLGAQLLLIGKKVLVRALACNHHFDLFTFVLRI